MLSDRSSKDFPAPHEGEVEERRRDSLDHVDFSRLSAQYRVQQMEANVDHRLMRDVVLREYRSGRQSREELCDASDELMRVATNLGVPSDPPCPICGQSNLVEVRFAFGQGLPPHGRVIESDRDLARLRDAKHAVDVYEVEVCTDCRWNYLLKRAGLSLS
jgi:hypothetical protein